MGAARNRAEKRHVLKVWHVATVFLKLPFEPEQGYPQFLFPE